MKKKKNHGGLFTPEGKVMIAVTLVWALYTIFVALVAVEVFG